MSMDYTRCHTARESALIQNQYEKIYRYCYFKLHNRELAEDITQEAFLRYLEKYRFTSSETALKYLYTIAGHLCIDEFFDLRTIPLFGHCFVSCQIVPVLYLICSAGITLLGRRIYRNYQVSGR